jgi:TatA/E family protein of Tat protein translocase
MFLFSAQGIFVIVIIALLLFGPEKLPEMARMWGRFMSEFKKAQDAVESTIRAEMYTQQTGKEPSSVAAPAAPAFTGGGSDEDEEEEDEE